MQVKKNGKVEHSANSHDDSVFSYLMALYVWYDGENLAEKFNIMKNTIKTDEDEEIIEDAIEDQLEKKEKIDMSSLEYDEDSDLQEAFKFIEENSMMITSSDLRKSTYYKDIELRNSILNSNKSARESYARETGLDPSSFIDSSSNSSMFVQLPDSIFISMNSDDNFDFDDESKPVSNITGNLADLWKKI